MKLVIKMPDEVVYLLDKLEASGFEAYIVGGCVRDSIMGAMPHDWDICTSANPNEIQNVFKDDKIILTGVQHGTITVVVNNSNFEITTFRIDGDYINCRFPSSVNFTKSLEEDLKRRDFTINAMVYNDKTGLVDLFSGYNDIQNKIIRCVGNPDDRFREDALRILRAWRFSCQLEGFIIDIDTLISAKRNITLLDYISAERIQSEFMKAFSNTKNFIKNIFINDYFLRYILPEWKLMDINQHNPHHVYSVDIHSLIALKYVQDSNDTILKLATFLHDIGKPATYIEDNGIGHFIEHNKIGMDIVDKFMLRLKFDNATREAVIKLVLYHDTDLSPSGKSIKRWLNKIGEKQLRRLIRLKMADASAQNQLTSEAKLNNLVLVEQKLDEIIQENACFSIKDLNINGNDLITIVGFKQGKHLGEVLSILLQKVIDEEIKNDRELLLNTAKEML